MDGIINVYKEKGYTSHDVVAVLRGILRTRKIGHTGTLDPDAEGVLPICVGKATKVADAIMGSEKVYEAALRFGCETDTQDASGTVTRTFQYDFCQEEAMAAISSFIGEYEQIPPMYSAVKVGGLKLYELARQGVEVERKARRVVIHEIQVLNLQETGAVVRVRCSKGTYIRTLCEDIGRRLGYGAHMQTLIRLQSGRFTREDSHTLDQIRQYMKEGQPEAFLQPLDCFFDELRCVTVGPEQDGMLRNGNPLSLPLQGGENPEELLRMYTSEHQFIGLYKITEVRSRAIRVKSYRMF